MSEVAAKLKSISIFSNWSNTRRLQFVYGMVVMEFVKGKPVFMQNDRVKQLHILVEGEVQLVVSSTTNSRLKQNLFKKRQMTTSQIPLALVNGPAMIGETDVKMALKKSYTQLATALVSSCRAKVYSCSKEHFHHFLYRDSATYPKIQVRYIFSYE